MGGYAGKMLEWMRNVLAVCAGLGKGVAGVWLTSSGRAQGGRGAGVWDACCGAVRRLLGGGQAQVCRGEGCGRHVQWGCGMFDTRPTHMRQVYHCSCGRLTTAAGRAAARRAISSAYRPRRCLESPSRVTSFLPLLRVLGDLASHTAHRARKWRCPLSRSLVAFAFCL